MKIWDAIKELFNSNTPIILDKSNPTKIYYKFNGVWREYVYWRDIEKES